MIYGSEGVVSVALLFPNFGARLGGGTSIPDHFIPGKNHLNAFTEGWVGQRSGLLGIKKIKSLLSTGVSTPYHSADSTLAIPTVLSRPHYCS